MCLLVLTVWYLFKFITLYFTGSFCERVWDTLVCWPPTPAGSIASIPCPNYLNGFNTARKYTLSYNFVCCVILNRS